MESSIHEEKARDCGTTASWRNQRWWNERGDETKQASSEREERATCRKLGSVAFSTKPAKLESMWHRAPQVPERENLFHVPTRRPLSPLPRCHLRGFASTISTCRENESFGPTMSKEFGVRYSDIWHSCCHVNVLNLASRHIRPARPS